MKNLFLKKKELMLVRMMETQNVTKRANMRSCSVPEAAILLSILFTVSLRMK